MHSKVYDKIKSFIKNNYKTIIFFSIMIFLFTYNLDCEIYTYGKPINLDNRIVVENSYESEGSFYLTYVQARKGIIPFVLLSKIIPSWDLVSIKNSQIENESQSEIVERGKIDLNSVNDYALKNALEYANIPYIEENKKLVVYHVLELADTDLKVGDYILKVDNLLINSFDEFTEYINTKEIGDKINILVQRDDKEINCYAIVKEDSKKIIGVYLKTTIILKSDTIVNFKYKNNEMGPSGGLMSALHIYNQLTMDDLTKGLKIAGTGSIDYDGNVESIGGVKYKLLGVVKNNMDVFIVPSGENYDEVLKIVKDNNYKIKIIEAKTFEQVINELKNLDI